MVPCAEGAGPYTEDAFLMLGRREVGAYGLRVHRNYQHFEWLDGHLRKDTAVAARLAAARVALPVEHRPRRLSDPSSWTASRPDTGERGAALATYLSAMLQVFSGEDAARGDAGILLKAFFSPDELFRPVRAALKHTIFSSTSTVLANALTQAARADASPFEAACGVRLRAEHVHLPNLDQCVLQPIATSALTHAMMPPPLP